MSITHTGDVGIGTLSPTEKLEVVGLVKATAFIGDGSQLTGISGSSQWDDVTGGINYANGNVGIGTTSPSGIVDIRKDIDGDTELLILNEHAGTLARALMRLGSAPGLNTMIVSVTGENYTGNTGWQDAAVISSNPGLSGGMVYAADTGGHHFQTDISGVEGEVMTITNAGDIGIGTTMPQTLIHLKDETPEITFEDNNPDDNREARIFSIAGDLYLESGEVGDGVSQYKSRIRLFNDTESQIRLYGGSANGGPDLTIREDGRVGIGISNPSTKFEVAGQVKITGGNPGTGKVLTSDANGLATWQTLTALSAKANNSEVEQLKAENKAIKQRLEVIEAQLGITNNIKQSSTTQNKFPTQQPGGAVLYQNTPNPFDQNTVIRYTLYGNTQRASIIIYNMNGEQLKVYNHLQGSNQIEINGRTLKEGMYLYRLIADGKEIDTKRMVLTK